MGRSSKKPPYVDEKLFKKINEMEKSKKKKPIKTYKRASMVAPEFVGYTIEVHNGKTFIPVYITENMVGHRLGEFAHTRVFRAHAGAKKEKTTIKEKEK